MATTTKQTPLPRFYECAQRRIEGNGQRTVNIKISINTCKMMIEEEQRIIQNHKELLGELEIIISYMEENESVKESFARQIANAKQAIARASDSTRAEGKE